MRLDEYRTLDALALAALVRRGDVSPAEVLDVALEAVAALDPALGAVAHLDEPGARAAVARGLPDGPLRGVPILVKDLAHDVAGTPTTHGSRLWAGNVADHDSDLVARYRRAGVVVLGRSRSAEQGLTPTTEPRFGGPTRNPWDPTRTAGGSSGGSGAAVAAGIVPAAHGTDGGGSIRIPAACCGLVGLKPSRGRTPAGPHEGEAWNGLSGGHVLTRTVADSAAFLDVGEGSAPGAPRPAPPVARPFLAEVGADPGRRRVAVVATRWSGEPVDPACRDAVMATARLLEGLGHVVEEAAPPLDLRVLARVFFDIVAANTAVAVDERLAALGREPGSLADDEVEPYTRQVVEAGRALPATALARAVRDAHRVGRDLVPFFARHDLLLTPTTGVPPWPLGLLDTGDPAGYGRAVRPLVPFTMPWNATGQPAVSLPAGRDGDGLPLGVQLVGRPGDEALLLRVAAQIEAAAPWAGWYPATPPRRRDATGLRRTPPAV